MYVPFSLLLPECGVGCVGRNNVVYYPQSRACVHLAVSDHFILLEAHSGSLFLWTASHVTITLMSHDCYGNHHMITTVVQYTIYSTINIQRVPDWRNRE